MDETLGDLLLLNSVDSLDARIWRRIRAGNIPLAQILVHDEHIKEIGMTENAAQKIKERLHSGWAERELEACEKSGAMITARLALELGREVWAVPGRIDEEIAAGANRLIYDGAHPLIDIEMFFGAAFGQQSLFSGEKMGQNEPVALSDLSEEERLIYEEIRLKGERTVDNIAVDVKMSAAGILKTIALLSAKGKIYSSGPGRYSAKV